MREDRRKHYDDGFRREALEPIKAGAGGDTLARRLADRGKWIKKYTPVDTKPELVSW